MPRRISELNHTKCVHKGFGKGKMGKRDPMCKVLEAREFRGKSQSAQQETRMLIWESRD